MIPKYILYYIILKHLDKVNQLRTTIIATTAEQCIPILQAHELQTASLSV